MARCWRVALPAVRWAAVRRWGEAVGHTVGAGVRPQASWCYFAHISVWKMGAR